MTRVTLNVAVYWVFIKLYHQDGPKEINSEMCTGGGKEALH